MSTFLTNHLILIIAVPIGCYIYYWGSGFRHLGTMTTELVNISQPPDEQFSTKEGMFLKVVGYSVFFIVGIFVWTLLGLLVGDVVQSLNLSGFVLFIVALVYYFIFLRFPFGVVNKTIEREYGFVLIIEKIPFAIMMIIGFIAVIAKPDLLPEAVSTWLKYL